MIFDLPKQIFDDLSSLLAKSEKPSAPQIKALIESAVRKCNLVSREEFDAQSAVLARTRQRLEELEEKIAALENTNSTEK